MAGFIGRQKELERLRSLLGKRSASLVVVRGRRRIGKSRLIREFGKDHRFHLFSGLPPTDGVTRQGQIDEFCGQMSRNFGMPLLKTKDWGEVFWHLGRLVGEGRVVLALDEISWIGSKDPQFLGQLKNAWDLYFSQNDQLILIVCGSVSSWIEKNLLSSTGFVGRISVDLQVAELPLEDAAQFWDGRKDRTSPHEILKVLSVTGAIPRYLEEIDPRLSWEENLRRLCFQADGFLFGEFDRIFTDLFSRRAPIYAEVLQSLVHGAQDIATVAKSVNVQRRATVANYLNDLCMAGFVAADPFWDLRSAKASSRHVFRLSDNYIRFYLKYVLPQRERIIQGALETAPLSQLPGWDSVVGLQFENLVLRNVRPILQRLRIEPSEVGLFGPYGQRANQRQKGCQIDLLIQTRFRVLYLCEVKFSSDPIGKGTGEAMLQKQSRLSIPRGWSSRLVLIHASEVTGELRQADVLDHIIDFSDFV